MTPLKIGLITDTVLQSQALKGVVETCGHVAAVTLSLTDQLTADIAMLPCGADAWLVNVDIESDDAFRCFHLWLDQCSQPVIFIDDFPEKNSSNYKHWLRRLSDKVERISGSMNLAREKQIDALAQQIKSIWVLAASTGGPEAVKKFLSNLPANTGIAFVYVQHIDSKFEQTLTEVMRRDSHYPVYAAEHGVLLRSDAVAVIGADSYTELHHNGTFAKKRVGWSGYYSPSADQVAANIARTFGARANMIIFSGMENDGATACRLIKQQGGQVWVQSPITCISSSMPEKALATGCVDYSASAECLAKKMAQTYIGV